MLATTLGLFATAFLLCRRDGTRRNATFRSFRLLLKPLQIKVSSVCIELENQNWDSQLASKPNAVFFIAANDTKNGAETRKACPQ